MFPVVLNDGNNEMPKDDVYYIIAKEGIFLKKKLGIMESLAPVKQISTLQSVAAAAKMHIEKIPGPIFAKVIEFFKAVYKEHYAEAIVLIFYDEVNKKYNIFPPRQKVTGGSCDYNRGITVEGYTIIGTIHSHAGMSAFHSGVDDKDEETFDGLHITIGNVRDDDVSISASIVANGYRIMVDPREYVNQLSLTQDIDEEQKHATTKIYKWIDGKLVQDEKETSRYTYSYRKYDKRYVVTVTDHQKVFNKKWLKAVEKGTYVYKPPKYPYGGYYGWGGGFDEGWGNGWGFGFDRSAWHKHGWHHTGQRPAPGNLPSTFVVKGQKPDPRNVGPCKTAGITFPDHEDADDDDLNPCRMCIHRDTKLEWALQQCTEEAEEEPEDEDLIDNFVSGDEYDEFFDADGNVTCHVCYETYHGASCSKCPACGAPNLQEVKVSQDPILGKDFNCPTCGNDFTHKGEDKCPFCDQELDFEDFRKEELKSREESGIEVRKAGTLTKSEWYMCNDCTTIFEAQSDEAECPNCDSYMILNHNCTPYNVEAEREALLRRDSGHLSDFVKSDILEKAAEADKHLERIPDPRLPSTPLSTHIQKTSRMSIKELKAMFKKTFGRKD